MLQQLYKFLILNKKAGIPGLGVFYIQRKPASLDFSKKVFTAPSEQISFTEGSTTPLKKFYSFLAYEQQIEEPEAVKSFDEFARSIATKLQSNGRADLPGFGLLTKDTAGAIRFQSIADAPTFFTDIATERTIRETTEASVTVKRGRKVKDKAMRTAENEAVVVAPYKKDYWWVFAILLAGAAIAAMVYYYYQHGSFR